MAQRYRVTVTQTHTVDVVAEDRDDAAMAAVAEVNRRESDLTHSGEIIRTDDLVCLVMAELPGCTWRIA